MRPSIHVFNQLQIVTLYCANYNTLKTQTPCRVSELIPVDDINKVIEAVKALPTTLQRYSYLTDLRNSKPGLFFAAMQQRPVELLPIVYTPGVGDACLNWGFLQPRPKALALSPADRGQFAQLIRAWSPNDISAVVVTDGTLPLHPACILPVCWRSP